MNNFNEKGNVYNFQADSEQLLDLMINSLYSNKEIFLRELISNSADAIEKLRFYSLKQPELLENVIDLNIIVSFNKEEKKIIVTDNGIGMTKDEIIENLGTLAKSGTKEFLKTIEKNEIINTQTIGKFGVGFYASFIVAKKIIVNSRKAGMLEDVGVEWSSTGHNVFSVRVIKKKTRGTEVILFLKDSEEDFLNYWKLRNIILKYSDHISVPILMRKDVNESEEIINNANALWTIPKSDITKQQYFNLYKNISNDYSEPILWMHNIVEGTINYVSLLFVPAKLSPELWSPEKAIGLKLYVQRVFIMSGVKTFLPNYLRFVCGIIDSSDVKINISREILQEDVIIKKIRTSITQKILSVLENLSTTDVEKYGLFWKEFGQILKEGPGEDFVNKERIAKLLRFNVYHGSTILNNMSLEEYIKTISEKQTKIYYITAEAQESALNNPHLEIFSKTLVKVLLLCDRIDEWLIIHLNEFLGYKFQSIVKSGIENDFMYTEENINNVSQNIELCKKTIERLKKCLESKVKDVKLTTRLISSPCCVVTDEYDLSLHMSCLIEAAGQNVRKTKPILEINSQHIIIQYLMNEKNDEKFLKIASILYEQAVIIEGGKIDDLTMFVKNINYVFTELLTKKNF